jgi:uncharacterized protein (TIGR00251 family)
VVSRACLRVKEVQARRLHHNVSGQAGRLSYESMIELVDQPDGVVLPVRAQPGAKANALRGEQGGALKVAVTQIAEKGKANQALVEVLAEELGLKKSQIELIAGETQREKRFLVRGVTREELARKIAEVLDD